VKPTYKEIVFTQLGSGFWSKNVLTFIKDSSNVRDKQNPALRSLSYEVLWSLIAIKLLETYYTSNKNVWKLAVNKGKRAIMKDLPKSQQNNAHIMS
jgi:hypothetical protein